MSGRNVVRTAVRALLWGLAATGAAAAQQPDGRAIAAENARAEPCRSIQSDEERLACYDRIFGRENGDLLPSTPVRKQEPSDDPATPAEGVPDSLLGERWELDAESKQGPFHMRPYKPVYILAAFHASSANETPSSPGEGNSVLEPLNITKTETKFQLSFKSKLWQNVIGDYSDLWFAYTQSSRWQTFNSEESRPFRETDYEPELMLTFRTSYSLFGWDGRLASIGINHQSNGRSEPLSRSWNRVIGQVGLERDGWVVMFRPWWRLKEDYADDDNPDIEDFMGRGEVLVTLDRGKHEFSAMYRHSLRTGDRSHGAFEFNWAFPIWGGLSGYAQFFNGYGESLIDYNRSASFFGVGVSLTDWYARQRR